MHETPYITVMDAPKGHKMSRLENVVSEAKRIRGTHHAEAKSI